MGNACGAGGSQAQADAREAKAARAENTLKHRGSSMIDDQGVGGRRVNPRIGARAASRGGDAGLSGRAR